MIPKKGHFHFIALPYEFSPEVYEMTSKTTKYGLDRIYTLYEHSLVPLNKILFPQFLKKLKEIRPHYVIVDQQAFSGAAACHILNIPFATSVTAPAAIERSKYFPKVMEFENAQIVKFQQEVGIAQASALICSSELTLIYSLPHFANAADYDTSFKFIGPIIADQKDSVDFSFKELQQQEGRTRILVSLGSILAREKWFIEMIINALGNQNQFKVVLVANPLFREEWPQNFIVKSFIPQQKVLRYIDMVICHAGHNTVMETLAQGIPLIALPIVNDQSQVATKVVKNGVGIRLKYKRVNSTILKSKVIEILHNDSYKKAAEKFQKKIANTNGTALAVHYLESNLRVL